MTKQKANFKTERQDAVNSFAGNDAEDDPRVCTLARYVSTMINGKTHQRDSPESTMYRGDLHLGDVAVHYTIGASFSPELQSIRVVDW